MDRLQVLFMEDLPTGATWIFPDTYRAEDSLAGWYWKYRAIDAYHGPYQTEKEAERASRQ